MRLLDRDKGKIGDGNETQLSLLPLCNKMNKLELGDSNSSENTNNFERTQIKDDKKINNNFEKDAVQTIGDIFSNIKIADEERLNSAEQSKETVFDKVLPNIECDEIKNDDQNIDKNEIKNVSCDEKLLHNENEKSNVNVKSEEDNDDEKDYKEKEMSSLVKLKKDDTTDEDSESEAKNNDVHEKSDKLCSRGPVPPQRQNPICSPYIYNRGLQCGGKTRIAEPLSALTENNCQLYANNVTLNYNIISEPELCEPPVQKSSVLSEELISNDISEAMIFKLYPTVMSTALDKIMKECSNDPLQSDQFQTTGFRRDYDAGLPSSPSNFEPSSPESSTSTVGPAPLSSDSGAGSDSLTDSLIDYPKDPRLPKEGNKTEDVGIWVQHTDQWDTSSHQVWPPKISGVDIYHPILPKPSAKSKFQELLDDKWRLRFWARVQSLSKAQVTEGDQEDGDTKLMIAVSNKFEGQLELIYALVERMRLIDQCLAAQNREKHSALYLACKLMPEQPLVAAYIAEALLEQGVDVANLRYESGYTLPQILEKEGDSHKAVLLELLTLKNGDDKLVFQSYLNYINGNK